jgi:hypothetical protein
MSSSQAAAESPSPTKIKSGLEVNFVEITLRITTLFVVPSFNLTFNLNLFQLYASGCPVSDAHPNPGTNSGLHQRIPGHC